MGVTMAARATWKGFLKLSLVTVPVKACTPSGSSTEIRMNQLHAECHNRIRYKKSAPITAKWVTIKSSAATNTARINA